jgi:predicted metal-dependent hydrolase
VTAGELWADRDEFERCVAHWAQRIGVEPRTVSLRSMRRKWASCSTQGRITFDLGLLEEPRDFGEAVIVHELVHLLVPNHGRLFKATLAAYMPECERRIHGHTETRPIAA